MRTRRKTTERRTEKSREGTLRIRSLWKFSLDTQQILTRRDQNRKIEDRRKRRDLKCNRKESQFGKEFREDRRNGQSVSEDGPKEVVNTKHLNVSHASLFTKCLTCPEPRSSGLTEPSSNYRALCNKRDYNVLDRLKESPQ